MGFFTRLKEGLTKTRDSFVKNMDSVFSGSGVIDEDFYEELEETLIMGDIGVRTTQDLLDELREQVKKQHIKDPMDCRKLLIDSIRSRMRNDFDAYEFLFHTSVIFVIGVNGVGKTTTIGKLAAKFRSQHKKVVIAAADTFRAAAGEQLKVWADRADAELISGVDGADPSAVVFDAIASAKAKKADVLLIDTAGRLHNKKNLMDELEKMNRLINSYYPMIRRENLVVLDGTTGQNALVQAKEFGQCAKITGSILTKMDGTAKGGIAVALKGELGIPVKYIGVGEKIEDLRKFDPVWYVDRLFEE